MSHDYNELFYKFIPFISIHRLRSRSAKLVTQEMQLVDLHKRNGVRGKKIQWKTEGETASEDVDKVIVPEFHIAMEDNSVE